MIRNLYYYLGREQDPHRNLALEEYLTAAVPAETPHRSLLPDFSED